MTASNHNKTKNADQREPSFRKPPEGICCNSTYPKSVKNITFWSSLLGSWPVLRQRMTCRQAVPELLRCQFYLGSGMGDITGSWNQNWAHPMAKFTVDRQFMICNYGIGLFQHLPIKVVHHFRFHPSNPYNFAGNNHDFRWRLSWQKPFQLHTPGGPRFSQHRCGKPMVSWEDDPEMMGFPQAEGLTWGHHIRTIYNVWTVSDLHTGWLPAPKPNGVSPLFHSLYHLQD